MDGFPPWLPPEADGAPAYWPGAGVEGQGPTEITEELPEEDRSSVGTGTIITGSISVLVYGFDDSR